MLGLKKTGGRRFARFLVWIGALLLLALLLCVGGLELALRLAPPLDIDSLYGHNASCTVYDRNGRILRTYLAPDDRWRIPVTPEDVSSQAIEATIAVEDKRFMKHGGVDLLAVVRALLTDIRRGKVVSGASTLTMQAAMLDQEKKGRTLEWKVRQVWRALRLERQLSKQEIFALYLSNAPYGGNLQGIEAAAQFYFGVSAKNLNLGEAALLAGVPQSPSRLRPDRQLTRTLVRRNHVLDLMVKSGRITAAEAARVKTTVPTITKRVLPIEAPHFCDLVHTRYPRVPRLKTTLDKDIQHLAEKVLGEQVRRLGMQGVTNGSVVIEENATGNVLAMVGSVNYNEKTSGQVNGALAVRSPGSALKPFIYGLALDRGSILPQTYLPDVPVNWIGYMPENFKRTYQGLVRADRALAWSLNLPALEVLRQVGVDKTVEFLRAIGLETINVKKDIYGLSLAIGSCGVRLLDLTNAYVMLTDGGRWKPWRLCDEDALSTYSFARVMWRNDAKGQAQNVGFEHRAVAWMLLNILSDSSLRVPENVSPELYGLTNVAWKTGTSSGYRDAWTVAMDRKYTVGVWLGNFNGKPSRALVGADAAAPVALSLIKELRQGPADRAPWPDRPASGLKTVKLCAETGLVARSVCPSTIDADAIVDADGKTLVLPPPCMIHRVILVDKDTGYEVCDACMTSKTVEKKSVAFWPVGIEDYLEKHGLNTHPQHEPSCTKSQNENRPKIISPVKQTNYVEDNTRGSNVQKIELKVQTPPDTTYLWWYANNVLVAHGSPADKLWWIPAAGSYVISVTDEFGRADSVEILVESPPK